MNVIQEPAYAKLNLSLDVLSRRPDGYHDMEMIFQLISMKDDLELHIHKSPGVRLSTAARFLPMDDSNIACRCARRFFEEAKLADWGVDIQLTKRLPVCAGMGGGSADGAAVLRALNRYFGGPFSVQQLLDLGAEIGADIPFCLIGGTALARGKGEKMEALPRPEGCAFVVVKPSFSVSTPELFQKLDRSSVKLHPDTRGMVDALEMGSLRELGRRLYNVFEEVLTRGKDTVDEIKSRLLDAGALGAAMTGTGSAVFGLFQDDGSAETACEALSRQWTMCHVARPMDEMMQINNKT
ncbi:MAG: 4-(cytidine 5'-diphospho)-2-C-methyl-D-erythritol kinase [Oscillospiraceae bacterium]|nr:4-(cytidine 5'-diphospho)-2-C-methyl-D-erythritol kinase [Oscillospiraceae bacterium]